MTRPLTDYRVITLDCYGTMIDWETGIWDALQPLIAANGRRDVTRPLALATFADLESAQEAATPALAYPDVLDRVHRDLAAAFGMESTEEMDGAFGASVPTWPAFPDSADALRALQASHRLAVLSNVDRAGLAASAGRLGVAFDLVCTADQIGSYKPQIANFEHLLARLDDELGISGAEVLHAAQSVYHDLVPAASLGLATAWIDRQGLAQGGTWGATRPVAAPPEPDFTFATLAEMAAAVAVEGA